MLDTEYALSLAAISADPFAKSAGLAVGETSAAAIIAARTGDGLEANVPYSPGNGPGVWQTTPPAHSAAATPWLGQLRPFTMKSPSQFLPDGPTPLNSVQWERDYIITKSLGGDATSNSARTPTQTEIGLFWTEHAAQQYARAFNFLVETRNSMFQKAPGLWPFSGLVLPMPPLDALTANTTTVFGDQSQRFRLAVETQS
jgi:hypothetical protein